MGAGEMSHGRAPASDDHLDHSIVIFVKKKIDARWLCVWNNIVNAVCYPLVRHEWFRLLGFGVAHGISRSLRL